MKTKLYFTLTLLTFVTMAFVPKCFAKDTTPVYVVRVIYFIPKNRDPATNMDEKLDTLMKDIKQFYADQMEAHGFGKKTFRIETDDAGNVVVHHVNGKSDDAYYQNPATGSWIVWNEIEEQFDTSKNIYFLVLESSRPYLDGTTDEGGILGRGSGSSLNGKAIIPAASVTDSLSSAAAHVLGNAFGLQHDSRVNAKRIYTSPFISDWMTTSYCASEWLNVHRYFNLTQKAFNENTNVEMRTLNLASPPDTIRLRFEVTDPDGLHQAQLFKPFGNYPSLVVCQGLNGKNMTVEFVINGLSGGSTIVLRIMDVNGNFTAHFFPINMTDLLPPPEAVSIPDPNLAASVRETLGLSVDDTITQLDMLRLTDLRIIDHQITDLTGIKHAVNIEYLQLRDNQIRDITPLSELKTLVGLSISKNPISDIKPLEGLTNLRGLYLSSTQEISDIAPLTGLTNLVNLSLLYNKSSDIKPLEGLTNLVRLYLWGNEVTDITPLAKLTNLRYLELNNNPITDITLLAGLTNLVHLSIGYTQVSDLTPLTGLTGLRELKLDKTPLSNIKQVTRLTQLTNLSLSGIPIIDITFLTELTGLRKLFLSRCQINDIKPLAKLESLETLYLNSNKIRDVSPLADLVNLQELWIVENPIKHHKPFLALLRKNPDIKIYLEWYSDPLPVTLSHFRAEHTNTGVILKWTTESEVDNAGFYIYRSETKDGEFKVVNPAMIQGAGTTGERNEYTWTDTTAKPNTVYYYRIEDVSYAGVREQLATVRLRGLVSARGKLTTLWADLKPEE